MSTGAVQPTRIEPHDGVSMLIEWSTGERFSLPFVELRFHCPCAECVDEHTGRRVIQRSSIPQGIRPAFVQVVGRYAMQATWKDGHQAGLYHFDYLHDLCGAMGKRLS